MKKPPALAGLDKSMITACAALQFDQSRLGKKGSMDAINSLHVKLMDGVEQHGRA